MLCPFPQHLLSVPPLSHPFHSTMSSVLHHLLFEDNDISGSLLISFSPFYLFHLSSSLFYSHPAMNQDLRTALSPECVWEQKYTSHLKMTSSFYAAANPMQAHGTLPSWTHYVHKRGRQRCRIKDKSKTNCKMQLPISVALNDCAALLSNLQQYINLYAH